jgi:hypothetical protein
MGKSGKREKQQTLEATFGKSPARLFRERAGCLCKCRPTSSKVEPRQASHAEGQNRDDP